MTSDALTAEGHTERVVERKPSAMQLIRTVQSNNPMMQVQGARHTVGPLFTSVPTYRETSLLHRARRRDTTGNRVGAVKERRFGKQRTCVYMLLFRRKGS